MGIISLDAIAAGAIPASKWWLRSHHPLFPWFKFLGTVKSDMGGFFKSRTTFEKATIDVRSFIPFHAFRMKWYETAKPLLKVTDF
jgi:hypothetical protein